jgi:hypothetical protein
LCLFSALHLLLNLAPHRRLKLLLRHDVDSESALSE